MPVPNHYVEISDEIHGVLLAHRERTGVGPTRLVRYMRRCRLVPDGSKLTLPSVESWFTRAAANANRRDLRALLNAYEQIQDETYLTDDTKPRQLVLLSDALRKELSSGLSKRRKYSLQFAVQSPDCPAGLSFNMMKRIAKGQASVLEAAVIRYIREFLAKN